MGFIQLLSVLDGQQIKPMVYVTLEFIHGLHNILESLKCFAMCMHVCWNMIGTLGGGITNGCYWKQVTLLKRLYFEPSDVRSTVLLTQKASSPQLCPFWLHTGNSCFQRTQMKLKTKGSFWLCCPIVPCSCGLSHVALCDEYIYSFTKRCCGAGQEALPFVSLEGHACHLLRHFLQIFCM